LTTKSRYGIIDYVLKPIDGFKKQKARLLLLFFLLCY